MTTEQKKEMYSWAEFDKDCEKIAAWAKRKKFKTVYGLQRGGLVLAVRLSHLLNIPLILGRDDITRDTLIVDDIVDGGGTMARLMATIGDKFRVASIFFNETSNYKPHYFVRHKKGWVIFPWETRRSSKYDGTV